MKQVDEAHAVGERIERLLDSISEAGDPALAATAEELVSTLVEFYGAGLTRIIDLIKEAPDGGAALLDRFSHDGLVYGLMALHDLHDDGVEARVHAALEKVRPYLGSHAGGVEFLGLDEDLVVHLKLEGTCDGCPSSLVTARDAIERFIRDLAPEVNEVRVAGVVEPPTVPEGRKLLPLEPCPVPEAG